MNKIMKLSQVFNTFFNKKAEEVAVKVGFIKRKRKLKGSSFIKSLIFGHLSQTRCSTDGLRKFLLEDNIDITKQGLEFRFTCTAVEFMRNMYTEALDIFQNKLPLNCAILQKFKLVKLLDSTISVYPTRWQIFIKATDQIILVERVIQNLPLNCKKRKSTLSILKLLTVNS